MADGPATPGQVSDWQTIQPTDWQTVGAGGVSKQSPSLFGRMQSNWESNTAPQDTGHPVLDFMHNAGGEAAKAFVAPVMHPVETAKGIGRAIANPYGEAVRQGMSTATSEHPMANLVGDTTAGVLQGGLLGGGVEAMDLIPRRARAVGNLNQAMAAAGDRPVSLTNTMPPLERVQQLSQRGHAGIQAADQLYSRANQTVPIDYREARDFQSSLSRLSPNEKGSLKGEMAAQIPRVSRALGSDVQETANQAGVGPEHEQGMREYAQNAKLRTAGKNIVKYGIPAAGIGIGARTIGRALYDMVPK